MLQFMKKWEMYRPQSSRLFDLEKAPEVGTESLGLGLRMTMDAASEAVERGSFYGSHIPRIGGFNELVKLEFAEVSIMHGLDCIRVNFMSLSLQPNCKYDLHCVLIRASVPLVISASPSLLWVS